VASVSGSVSVPAALVEPLVVEPSLSPLVALAPVVVVALVVELVLLAALVDDPSVMLSVAPPVEGSNSRLSLRQAALSSSAKQGAVIVAVAQPGSLLSRWRSRRSLIMVSASKSMAAKTSSQVAPMFDLEGELGGELDALARGEDHVVVRVASRMTSWQRPNRLCTLARLSW
jgi:hypothetical protein